jgi:hypothetical protein
LGLPLAPIYGENYRYTTAYGLWSNQLLNKNANNGYDIPMAYGEVFIPQLAEGLMIRFGRYISIPDIEAQLAPNNYMYTHSMTYTFDNYTNTGVNATLAATKNWILQLGVTVGTEAMPWHVGQQMANPMPNPLYQGTTMRRIPARYRASPAACAMDRQRQRQHQFVANGINGGSGATTTCNGTASPPITSSTISGTSRSKPTTSTRTTSSTSTIPPRLPSFRAAARRSRRSTCRSTHQLVRNATTRPCSPVRQRCRLI